MAHRTMNQCGKPKVSPKGTPEMVVHHFTGRPVLMYPKPGYKTPDLTGKYPTILRSGLGIAAPIYGPRDIKDPLGYTGWRARTK